MDWRDWEVFETREEWDTSAVVENLKTDFTLRTGKLSSRQVYHCRFARKKGFNCGVKVKLTFSEVEIVSLYKVLVSTTMSSKYKKSSRRR